MHSIAILERVRRGLMLFQVNAPPPLHTEELDRTVDPCVDLDA
jgi:hypothetical protein